MAGHPLVYYNPHDVRSYTIGKVVGYGRVRTYRGAVWQTVNAWFDAACTDPDDERLVSPDDTLADMQPGVPSAAARVAARLPLTLFRRRFERRPLGLKT
jgi:hypothetical protein